ncbi:MAG TPA: HAD family hydrolase [Miltoncostaeaceae bacterium]|nr:HAD family hydrolase [Miltoncostaeaceae bacterium]
MAHLILDLGGVVLPSAMPQVIAQLAELSPQSEQQLWRFFNTRLFRPFWSGEMSVEEFWDVFTAQAGVPGATARWQTELTTRMLEPLPGAARVRRWAERVPVGVLSNQRGEWVLPVLDRAGLTPLLSPLLVSSMTGLVKPDPRAFAQLTQLGVPPAQVLYVDDRPQALRRAEWHGVSTMQALDGAWMDRVDERLGLDPPAT